MAETNEYLRAGIKNMDAMFKEGIPATTYDRMFVEGNVYHAVGTISDGYTSASIIGEDIPRNEMVYAEARKISDVVKPGVPIFNPGRTIGGKVIKLNSEQLRQYKQKLTQAADEVKNIWNTLKNTHVQQLTDSWAGADASAYINNFRSFDSKVNASVEALDLLARTFERAAKELESTQENIKQFMNRID